MSVSRELVEAIKIMTDREKNGEHTPDWWEDLTEAQIIGIASRPAETIFVNVYALDRCYGGPEEGGWWFDEGRALVSIQTTTEHVDLIADLMRSVYMDNGNRYSVIYFRKDDDHMVYLEGHPAEDWSDYRPYE